MLATLVTCCVLLGGEGRARWRCEPAQVALGEPFELVLELEHSAALSGDALAAGELELGDSWVVLEEEPVQSTRAADGSVADGNVSTRRTWRVASLEPGKRDLGEALSRFALPDEVARIQVGNVAVDVRGVLAEGENAPRPLREFPDGFAGDGASDGGSRRLAWLAAGVLLVAGAGAFVWQRRRSRRAASAPRATPLERLGELERALEGAAGREVGRESCFELTHLLRATTDASRARDRSGLTDEEWLAELAATPEVPRTTVGELEAVFERAARVKYAGEPATTWALQETFARARTALSAVGDEVRP